MRDRHTHVSWCCGCCTHLMGKSANSVWFDTAKYDTVHYTHTEASTRMYCNDGAPSPITVHGKAHTHPHKTHRWEHVHIRLAQTAFKSRHKYSLKHVKSIWKQKKLRAHTLSQCAQRTPSEKHTNTHIRSNLPHTIHLCPAVPETTPPGYDCVWFCVDVGAVLPTSPSILHLFFPTLFSLSLTLSTAFEQNDANPNHIFLTFTKQRKRKSDV